MRAWVVAAVLAVALLAGCVGSGPTGPTSTETPTAGPTQPAFDGAAAYAYIEGLVTDADGNPRPRVPGTPEHVEAGRWLESQMTLEGWSLTNQSFTGEDFDALDKGSANTYRESRGYCSEADEARMKGLNFTNYYATYDVPDTERIVIFGAHWESKAEASDVDGPVLGANDGASGVGVLLQLMRHIDAIQPPVDVGILFVDGEDGFEDCHALAGSTYFAHHYAATAPDARYVNLDMVGDANARYIRESRSVQSDPAMVDLVWDHGSKYAPDAFTDRMNQIFDDHVPFLERGIPAIDIIDMGESGRFQPYWHTSRDDMRNIDVAMLEAVGNTVWAVLQDARLTAEWPGTPAAAGQTA